MQSISMLGVSLRFDRPIIQGYTYPVLIIVAFSQGRMVERATDIVVSGKLPKLIPCSEDVYSNAQVDEKRGQNADPYQHVVGVDA